jgi:hypothetical protein
MKASNLILSACGAAAIAFDAMREYDSETVFNRLQQRYLDRYIRNWQGCPEIGVFFKSRLIRLAVSYCARNTTLVRNYK